MRWRPRCSRIEQPGTRARSSPRPRPPARAAGIACRGISTVSDRPAQAILDAAEKEGCDLIFMASRGPTSLGGVMLGSQTLKVLVGAKIPVLVSSVAHNARHGARDAAMATIKDEHRSIAALLHALRSVVGKSAHGSTIDTSARARRGPLPACVPGDAASSEGGAVHLQAAARSARRSSIACWTSSSGSTPKAGRSSTRWSTPSTPTTDSRARRRRSTRRGMPSRRSSGDTCKRRSKSSFPAAQEVLTDDDWSEIADAFRGNGDPRFDRLVDSDFREIFARIMNLAGPADDSAMANRARAGATPSPDPLERDRLAGNTGSPTDAA